MSNNKLESSELILNDDGSVYHINLRPEHIADTVILVGDQGRVSQISRHFDKIEFKISNREFNTHTGVYRGKRVTVLSTGIGTDNIDIVINELDAAVNIDLKKRKRKESRRVLNLIRIGTSGAIHPDIEVGSHSISEFGLGFDGLIYYYHYDFSPIEQRLTEKVNEHLSWNPSLSKPYVIESSNSLFNQLKEGMVPGITATASGFYGPQGRRLNLTPRDPMINHKLSSFQYDRYRITNFEMETSALYALGKMLGHNCCTTCAIIANRTIKEYSKDHIADIDNLIETVLSKI